MADYLDAFARESEEQITELNNALLEFEDDPSDEAAMDRIFRTAHTLKGNCGAMGFEPAEDLAHAIEDLLEAIRSNRVAVSPEVMDAIFDGVDELDAMISEAVEHGEVTREGDAEVAAIREYADTEGLAAPADAEIDELLESISAPSNDDHSVYHVRLDVAGDPAVHGRAVVDALDDAFELLGTAPGGETIDAGDYDGTIDAAFASVVQRAAVEAALEPVDAVADQVITDATKRSDDLADDPEDVADAAASVTDGATEDAGGDEGDPADLSVDELLEDEDVDQFDDLDEMAEDVGDTSEFEDLGDAGSFADLGITGDDVDLEAADDATSDSATAEDRTEHVDADATDESVDAATADANDEPADDEEVEDAAAEFAKLKEEVDPVGFDELQDELADLEFDEYDSDDEVGFDELLEDDELEDDGAFAESAVTAAAAEDAAVANADEADAPVADADDLSGDAGAIDDAATADAGEPDATAEDLFGGPDDAEPADSPSPEVDTSVEADAAPADGDDPSAVDEPATTETDADDDDPATDEGVLVGDDESLTAAKDDADLVDDESIPTANDEGDPVVEDVTDDEAFDASAQLDSASLDEGAQSFGEDGLDLTDESVDEEAEDADEVPTDTDWSPSSDDELDLDDTFGEMEAEAIDEASTETAEDAADAATEDDAFDLGEADLNFGDGTIAGADDGDESGVAESVDEGLGIGEALEDDSFGDGTTEADLDPDAGTAVDDTDDEAVEPVDGFGDDSVLDLDDSAVAGSEAAPAGDEDSLEAIDAEAVGSGARIESEADAGFDAGSDAVGDASMDVASTADQSSDGDPSADALDDPGFSDGSEAEDDGPDVDEERIERIRSLGVPGRNEDAAASAAGTQSIRVDVDALDSMLNMVEGLVTSRARLRRALIEDEPREVLEDELDDLEDVTSELQDTVMDVRLVPLRTAVNKLPRIVRDVAREEGKDVDLEMVGEDVELDRSILDEIGDPLVHLVRNAVDHGIESPEEREAAGKPIEGSIELRATRERDRVMIVVEDDGAGIDADAVRDAAVEEGTHTRSEVDSMDDDDVLELIFHSGFSTAAEVTDVSGRGVGMDVVAETVDRLDGIVSVDTEPGEGTTITMELPVTLAIVEVLFVDVGGEEYGIPIKTVDEIGPVVDVETQDGREVLVSDGGEDRRELIRLGEALSTPGRSDPNAGMLVHLRDDVREAAIHCDRVREQQEVVVKPFEGVLGDVPGLSGASVLGDGDVVTILDVETL